MSQKITNDKVEFIKDYINRIKNEFSIYEDNLEFCNNENTLFDLLFETIKVFKEEIPEMEDAVLFRNGTSVRDANTVIALLKKYLIDNGYKEIKEKNSQIEKFWLSFKTYFENELPYEDLLKDDYIRYDNWDGGTYYNDINYNYQFNLHYGIDCEEENFEDITYIKLFIELAFKEWIKSDKRYDFTKKVNQLFRNFKLPYKLQQGKVVGQGYKTTNLDDKIINYAMLERKIQFAEEMILSKETLDKKVALDYIVDSLQYLISIQSGKTVKDKYSNSAFIICGDKTSKKYVVLKNEIEEIMKISNVFFDIRHNEYLNAANEIREAITDPIFIEYLYNRVYSILYVLKLKTKITF